MSRITDERFESIGEIWLGSATRPSAAMTVVMPMSIGTSAATSEPKASTRISSVRGNDSSSALPRSDEKVSLSSLFELTEPNCSIRRPGWAAATAATASLDGSIRLAACSEFPVISKSTSADRPSCEIGAARGQRRGDLADVLGAPQADDGVGDGGAEGGIANGARAALDQHVLVVGPQARAVQGLLGTMRLAGELVRVPDLVLPDRVAEQERDDDEAQPAEDGGLTVSGAPAGGARGEVAVLVHGGSSEGG